MKITCKKRIVGTESSTLPGPGDYEPPEYDDPSTRSDMCQIEVEFDDDVIVQNTGDWEFVSDTSWAENPDDISGSWYDLEYGIYLGDADNILDYVIEVLTTNLPAKGGTYHVSGIALLVFDIGNINVYDAGSEDEFEDMDSADITLNMRESRIENLTII